MHSGALSRWLIGLAHSLSTANTTVQSSIVQCRLPTTFLPSDPSMLLCAIKFFSKGPLVCYVHPYLFERRFFVALNLWFPSSNTYHVYGFNHTNIHSSMNIPISAEAPLTSSLSPSAAAKAQVLQPPIGGSHLILTPLPSTFSCDQYPWCLAVSMCLPRSTFLQSATRIPNFIHWPNPWPLSKLSRVAALPSHVLPPSLPRLPENELVREAPLGTPPQT